MLSIQKFTPRDLLDITKLAARTLREVYHPNLYLNLHANWPEGFLIARERRTIVGFVLGSRQTPQQARILLFSVAKAKRRRGIGDALLKRFILQCLIDGIREVTLEVRVSNTTAIQFYRNRGFRLVDQLASYYTDNEDGYVMYRAL